MRNCESAQCYFTGLEDNCVRLCFTRRVFMLLIMVLAIILYQVILIQLNVTAPTAVAALLTALSSLKCKLNIYFCRKPLKQTLLH
jgi:hypothetical protein